ncbi:MAG: hypothetical protein QOI11_708 [Candidatus Eremiobacteraeota bacterium]|nr:hypothetical protein [Candidatus Eremiobacteraeota bacterium]
MEMGDRRAPATRSRAVTRPLVGSLTGFELFILGLIVAMVADVGLFAWLVVREFTR